MVTLKAKHDAQPTHSEAWTSKRNTKSGPSLPHMPGRGRTRSSAYVEFQVCLLRAGEGLLTAAVHTIKFILVLLLLLCNMACWLCSSLTGDITAGHVAVHGDALS